MAHGKEQIPMDRRTLEAYRQRLLAQQQQIVKRIFDLEEELQGTTADEMVFDDRAQALELEEVLERLDEQSRQEAEDIQAALARLDAGTYGQYETCGKAISAARLNALPVAHRCVHCHEQEEHIARE
jgi:RNA polymerase-binding transcription factor